MLEKTVEIERLMAPVLDGMQARHLEFVHSSYCIP